MLTRRDYSQITTILIATLLVGATIGVLFGTWWR